MEIRYVKRETPLQKIANLKQLFNYVFFIKLYLQHLLYYYNKIAVKRAPFVINGEQIPYFIHQYNYTYYNERCVEIAYISHLIKKYQNKRILEVGNVMSHYFGLQHMVIDKFEKAKGVINDDALTFYDSKGFDLIISISTFEHIGWDDSKRDNTLSIQAYENLKRSLSQNGELVITAPIGYNPEFDANVLEGKFDFSALYFMKRLSLKGDWKQIDKSEIGSSIKYGHPYPSANVIMIGSYIK